MAAHDLGIACLDLRVQGASGSPHPVSHALRRSEHGHELSPEHA